MHGNLAWSHDPWDIGTHLVWVLFMIGLITETRCWKERLFFVLVLANFAFAFSMGLWASASGTVIADARLLSAGVWAAAALVSLGLLFSKGDAEQSQDRS